MHPEAIQLHNGGAVMRKLASCMPALLIAGCSIDSFNSLLSQRVTEQSEESNVARQDVNTLAPRGLLSSGLTTARLDAANAAAMGSSEDARQVLTYAIGCALDSTQTVAYTVDGVTYSSVGGIGLARGWTNSPLSVVQAAWVSACVFAHANEFSTVIWISVRGNQADLDTTSDERSEYQREEGAFWGNAFTDLGPIAAYACDGIDPATTDGSTELPRQCAHWDGIAGSHKSSCGMGYAGMCRSICTTSSAPYTGCSFLGAAASPTVITTFLSGPPD
jgi:hypothetical protein